MVIAEDSRFGRQSAIAEAHAIYRMLGHDVNTVEELRELIAVPPKIERALRAFAKAHVQDAYWIEATLKFRESVAREFEGLVCDGLQMADLPQVEMENLQASTEAVAFAQM
jgi:hypothetical protein